MFENFFLASAMDFSSCFGSKESRGSNDDK